MAIEQLSDVVVALVAGAIGFGSSSLTARLRDGRALRIEAVDGVVPALDDLRRLIRFFPVQAEPAQWHIATTVALESLEAQTHRLPPAWRHLLQSVRIAVGEATGAMAFADRYPLGSDSNLALAPYCPTWANHAEEYLTYSIRSLREWRDDLGLLRHHAPGLWPFDTWLARTDRQTTACACGTGELHRGGQGLLHG